MPRRKLRCGTSKTKQLVPVHLDLSLFWASHCATCIPTSAVLYHLTRSCKGPILNEFEKLICSSLVHITLPLPLQPFYFFSYISQDSHQLSTCEPGHRRYDVRNIYCTRRYLDNHWQPPRGKGWYSHVQIVNSWDSRLGWSIYFNGYSCYNRLWAIFCSDLSL